MRTRLAIALAGGLSIALLAGLAPLQRPTVSDKPETVTPSRRQDSDQKSKSRSESKSKTLQEKSGTKGGRARSDSKSGAQGDSQGQSVTLAFPTGERGTSLLLIEAKVPNKVRVGHEYTYTIKATNLADSVVLEDVQVTQEVPDSLEIENSKPSQAGGQAGTAAGRAQWSFDRLGPGESKTIQVTAVAGSEGTAETCLRARFQPAICLATEFIKPELSLTKEAPETTDICEPFTVTYTLENTGSASAKGLSVRDDLPDGLTTAEGKKAVEYQVDELPKGESKKFEVKVRARKTGEYSSRAVAAGGDDLKVQSRRTTTAVRQAVLAVSIDGPDAQYINEPATYTVNVTNEGDAPAKETSLNVELDDHAKLIEARAAGDKKGDDGQSEGEEGRLSWQIGTLKPGDSRQFKITATGQSKAELTHTAVATSACARGQENEELKQAATARAETETRILTLPALLISAVDREDPVTLGDEETYTITIVNQGTGADNDVQVKCTLPENYKFVGVDGPTGAKADGKAITFEPIDTLEPGDTVRWHLKAKAESEGDVQLRVELTSEYLSQPAISTEPTRLIK